MEAKCVNIYHPLLCSYSATLYIVEMVGPYSSVNLLICTIPERYSGQEGFPNLRLE